MTTQNENDQIQTAQTIPTLTETAMFSAIMIMLIINLMAIIHFTNYEPICAPVTMERVNAKK